MDISKYKFQAGSKTKPYAIPLPEEATAKLDRIRHEGKLNVRALLRDLILDYLPTLEAEMDKV